MSKTWWTGLLLLLLFIVPAGASATQLRLSWTDNSSNESGFRILRKTAGPGPLQLLTTVGPNITSYTDTRVIPGVIYCYRVRAFNAEGRSASSNRVCSQAQ